jgi:hypothetical protein
MFMLAAVFSTTCQIVFSEMQRPHGLPGRQTHRNSGPLSIPAAVNHASSVSFPIRDGNGSNVPSLAKELYDSPARSSRRCKLSSVSSASSWRRRPQPSRIARLARLRFPVKFVHRVPAERRCLAHCKPAAQARVQLANTLNAPKRLHGNPRCSQNGFVSALRMRSL